MAFTNGKAALRKALIGGVAVVTALMLNACGGGGGSSGTNSSGGGGNTPAITLSLVAPSTSSSNLAAYGSTTLQVKVLSNGVADTNSVSVTFSSPCAASGKAILTASALTTAGIAQATYTDKGCSATDTITIATAGATSITATLVVAAPTPASIQFVSANPSSDSIVIHGSGGNGRVETATLTYKVLDTFGNALPNEAVNFSVFPSGVVTLGAASGITGADGQVTVSVSSGSQPTTFRVNATLPSGQTTISDTITVTTGQTSAPSFSLSVETYNIEGWGYDGTTTPVTIFLADAFGNPVADGTPVVFQTDSGAIGSSANGGCVTANGTCSVTFRSQNPRYGAGATPPPAGKRAGLATINVSTTTANTTISGKTGIFLSGSFVESVNVASAGNTVTSSGGVYSIAVAACGNNTFDIQLNDVNNNPMPLGTTIAASATTAGSPTPAPTAVLGKIFPATVLEAGASSLTDTTSVLGTVHTVQFTPGGAAGSATVCGGAGIHNGEIDLTITTPKGNVTLIPVLITYP